MTIQKEEIPDYANERVAGPTGIYLILLILPTLTHAQDLRFANDKNLIKNGSFEIAGKKGFASDWMASGPLVGARLQAEDAQHGTLCQEIKSTGKRALSFWQDVSVESGKEYYFSAKVRADDRLFVRIGRRTMAYNALGKWQKLVGVVRSGKSTTLKVWFFFGGLTGKENELLIDEASLREVADFPDLPARLSFGSTVLTGQGKAEAVLVIPANSAEYENNGEQIQRAITELTGVQIPLAMVSDVTEPDHPVIKKSYSVKHLILLGRLGLNRAMWPAYSRFLCAADGYYPGGDGYVVRTASNVLRNGKNHIIIGGSSEAGVKSAVARFIEILGEQKRERGELKLPWLLDVQLGGECLRRFKERDELWSSDPLDKALPRVEPGYGTIRRWYQNAMSYYWSGWPSYRKRTLEYVQPILKERAYTHHYTVEFFVRTWDMLDDSGLFDDSTRRQMDGLIYKNFREFLVGPDLTWMTVFAPPYDSISLTNRHSIAPWMADLKMADFVNDYFDLKSDLADIVAHRRSEKHRFMEHLVAERWGPSLPGSSSTGHQEEIVASLFRYALDHERYEFFANGNARRALGLDFINHQTGLFVRPAGGIDHHLQMGTLASYYQDGRYLPILNSTPLIQHVTGPFMGRYVNGVRRYTPGPELKPAAPDAFSGVRIPEMMPHWKRHFPGLKIRGYRKPAIDADEAFAFASFRSGFNKNDDYIAISGLAGHIPPGSFLDFSSAGTNWFGVGGSAIFSPSSDSYFDQNAVHVLRSDRWLEEGEPYSAAAKLDWKKTGRNSGGVAFTLEPHMGTRWQRQVLWLKPGLFVVRDSVTALEDGRYQIAVNWRPQGSPAWNGRTLTSSTNTGRLRITPLGDSFRIAHNLQSKQGNPGSKMYFRQVTSVNLKSGEEVVATTVLQGKKPPEPDWECRMINPGQLLLKESKNSKFIKVAWNGRTEPPLTESVTSVPEEWTKLFVDSSEQEASTSETSAVKVVSKEEEWRQVWKYDGLLRPTRIRGVKKVTDGMVDLGRVYELSEIRAVLTGPLWQPTELPEEIWVAHQLAAKGGIPDKDSPTWKKPTAESWWRPAVHTGNYGRADPVAQGYQTLYLNRQRARFVRAENAHQLIFYDAGHLTARRPLQLTVEDVNEDDVPEILVSPRIWPKFIRYRQEEDDAAALLNSDGQEMLRLEPAQNIQSLRLLRTTKGNQKQVVMTTVDAKIRVHDIQKKTVESHDLYAMHRQFNKTKGRPNTRHPAGGYTMPYALGLWRPGPAGKRKFICARYGWLSFLDGQGKFEGVLAVGGYVIPGLLPHGVDFDNDGVEEQLCLTRGTILQIDGEATPVIHDPGGSVFYPQVYSTKRLLEPAWDKRIDGSRILKFETLPWGAGNRYVIAVRENYLGIYDALNAKWAFTWVPVVKLKAAEILASDKESLTMLAFTADGLLWELRWQNQLDKLSSFKAVAVDFNIHAIAPWNSREGQALLATDSGLILYKGNQEFHQVAEGRYRYAKSFTAKRRARIVAVTFDGKVECLEMRAP